MRKLNILNVILAFYPNQIWGGPPRIALTIGKGLQARGHHVQVLTTNILDHQRRMSEHSFQGEWDGLPVTYLNTIWHGRTDNSVGFIYSTDLWCYRHLIAQADIIHIHGYRHFLFLGTSLLAKLYKKPVLLQPHGTLTGKFGRTGLKRIYDATIGRGLLSTFSAVISLSQEEERDAFRLGVLEQKIVKILNPIDLDECPQLPTKTIFREKFGILPHEKIVLFLSRLHEKKGLDLLIEAVGKLERRDIRLCVVGPDDGFLEKAKQIVVKEGLQDQTLFIGPLYGAEKYEAYCAADVYALTTRGSEGLPTTVLEACYAGTPVVVTDTTEIASLLHKRVGLAVQSDTEEISAAIQTILNDSELRTAFARETRKFIDDYFSLDGVLDQYESLYGKILEKQSE